MTDITWTKLTDRQRISILTAYDMEQTGQIADSRIIPGATGHALTKTTPAIMRRIDNSLRGGYTQYALTDFGKALAAEQCDDPDANSGDDPVDALRLRYYDYRIERQERHAVYMDYKSWLEDQVINLQELRAAELDALKPFARVAKETRESRYSLHATLAVTVLYCWLEAAEKALTNAAVSIVRKPDADGAV